LEEGRIKGWEKSGIRDRGGETPCHPTPQKDNLLNNKGMEHINRAESKGKGGTRKNQQIRKLHLIVRKRDLWERIFKESAKNEAGKIFPLSWSLKKGIANK